MSPKVIDIARQRKRIVARKQRIAKTMFLAGFPVHEIRRALGVQPAIDASRIKTVSMLYEAGYLIPAIVKMTGLSRRQIQWCIDRQKRDSRREGAEVFGRFVREE